MRLKPRHSSALTGVGLAAALGTAVQPMFAASFLTLALTGAACVLLNSGNVRPR